MEKKIITGSSIWDLHIHTCQCSKASSEFKGLSVKTYIDKLIDLIKDYSGLELISFTDHNRINIEVYKEFLSRNINVNFLLNITLFKYNIEYNNQIKKWSFLN